MWILATWNGLACAPYENGRIATLLCCVHKITTQRCDINGLDDQKYYNLS